MLACSQKDGKCIVERINKSKFFRAERNSKKKINSQKSFPLLLFSRSQLITTFHSEGNAGWVARMDFYEFCINSSCRDFKEYKKNQHSNEEIGSVGTRKAHQEFIAPFFFVLSQHGKFGIHEQNSENKKKSSRNRREVERKSLKCKCVSFHSTIGFKFLRCKSPEDLIC